MSLKQCCATGSLHTGTPTGRIAQVHGLDCYIADAPNGSPKGIVVIIPDAFGWTLPNNKILADCYAKEGNFTVYLPEFMNGWAPPEDILLSMKAFQATGFMAQINKIGHAAYCARHFIPFLYNCRRAVCEPKVVGFMKSLKQNEAKSLPVGTAGFCWGGQYVAKFSHNDAANKLEDGTQVTDCGFTAHPSFLSYYGDIEKVSNPISIAASEHDMQMSPEQAKQTEAILTTKTEAKTNGVTHEFVMYQGAHHGFAVRADEKDLHEADCGKRAEAQAVAWFSKWFGEKAKL